MVIYDVLLDNCYYLNMNHLNASGIHILKIKLIQIITVKFCTTLIYLVLSYNISLSS